MFPSLVLTRVKRRLSENRDRWFPLGFPGALTKVPAPSHLSSMGLLHSDISRADFRERFLESYPEDSAVLIREADQTLDLVFNLLGSGPVDMKQFGRRDDLRFVPRSSGRPLEKGFVTGLLPWHFDFKKGIGWNPKTFFADILYGTVPGVDIKIPWELSRCQHFIRLGQAYRLTGNEKYAQGFVAQMGDWIAQNPPKRGVNWASAMEVALRACNWIVAMELFKGSSVLIEPVQAMITKSLEVHGRHIASYLEWNADVSTNHYLSDLLGLFYIGTVFKSEWKQFAEEEFKKEILKQTYADGFDHEGSTAYHKFVLEIFYLYALSSARRLQIGMQELTLTQSLKMVLGEPGFERLGAMFTMLNHLSNSEGNIPLIGDNDSGRIHSFFNRSDSDARGLSEVSSCLGLGDAVAAPLFSENVWLFGFELEETSIAYKKSVASDSHLPASGGSGLLVLKGADDHLVFSAQPNGTRGLGNHTHNDKLAFTLMIHGDEFFIDPGCGTYTSDPLIRNRFRSTLSHNTIQIDGLEQNDFMPGDLFALINQSRVAVETYDPSQKVAATHDGYTRMGHPVLHRRSIERKESGGEWTVEDQITGMGSHELKWNFTLGAGIQVKAKSSSEVHLIGSRGRLEINSEIPFSDFEVEEMIYSAAYGSWKPTQTLRYVSVSMLPVQAVFHLVWKPLL